MKNVSKSKIKKIKEIRNNKKLDLHLVEEDYKLSLKDKILDNLIKFSEEEDEDDEGEKFYYDESGNIRKNKGYFFDPWYDSVQNDVKKIEKNLINQNEESELNKIDEKSEKTNIKDKLDNNINIRKKKTKLYEENDSDDDFKCLVKENQEEEAELLFEVNDNLTKEEEKEDIKIKNSLKNELIGILENDETVAKALIRLKNNGAKIIKKDKKSKNNIQPSEKYFRLVEIVSLLTNLGEQDLYTFTSSILQKSLNTKKISYKFIFNLDDNCLEEPDVKYFYDVDINLVKKMILSGKLKSNNIYQLLFSFDKRNWFTDTDLDQMNCILN